MSDQVEIVAAEDAPSNTEGGESGCVCPKLRLNSLKHDAYRASCIGEQKQPAAESESRFVRGMNRSAESRRSRLDRQNAMLKPEY